MGSLCSISGLRLAASRSQDARAGKREGGWRMALGVDLGQAGIPDCNHVIEGETKDEVLANVRDHLQTEHGRTADDSTMDVVAALIGPIRR